MHANDVRAMGQMPMVPKNQVAAREVTTAVANVAKNAYQNPSTKPETLRKWASHQAKATEALKAQLREHKEMRTKITHGLWQGNKAMGVLFAQEKEEAAKAEAAYEQLVAWSDAHVEMEKRFAADKAREEGRSDAEAKAAAKAEAKEAKAAKEAQEAHLVALQARKAAAAEALATAQAAEAAAEAEYEAALEAAQRGD